MTIGERIKMIRLERGMTQKQLADNCDLYDSTIRKYESDKQNPKIETLKKIAKALDVPYIQFLEDIEEYKQVEPLLSKVVGHIFTHDNEVYIRYTDESVVCFKEKKFIDYLNQIIRKTPTSAATDAGNNGINHNAII